MMDLGELRQTDSAFMQLEHPVTGEPLATDEGEPIGIVLVGIDSKPYRAKQSEVVNRRLGRKQKKISAEQVDREGAELLAGATVSFRNVVINGEQPSVEGAADVYHEHRWIREQVDSFVADRANFFTSAPSD